MKRFSLFLFIATACTNHIPTLKAPFEEHLVRSDKSVSLKKIINNQPVEILAITDSILLITQKNEKTDAVPFETYFFAFNDSMDLNADTKKDLVIYSTPNMHGQCLPIVFLSDKKRKLHYRSDLSLYNIQYDTITKQIHSFYAGGMFTKSEKNSYVWKNDSLELFRGASYQVLTSMGQTALIFYKGENHIPYKTFKNCCEDYYDTAVFNGFPGTNFKTDLK